jgi:hypothetical protein
MQRIKTCAALLGVVLGLVAPIPKATAQEGTAKAGESTPKTTESKPGGTYRLEFVLNELEDGKRINTRSYSMLAQAGGVLNKLRIGLIVPVNRTEMYPGMSIDCRVDEQESSLVLTLNIDSTNFTQPLAQNVSDQPQPVVRRQVRAELKTVVSLGKPTLVTSMDDPVSRRQFQIEVTATKAK